jgi:hypothetical protein
MEDVFLLVGRQVILGGVRQHRQQGVRNIFHHD